MKQIPALPREFSIHRALARALAAFSACGIILSAGSAMADESNPSRELPTSGQGWIITVGAMAAYSPDYDGSKANSWRFSPTFDWRREGEAKEFSSPDDGFDLALIDTPTFKMGPVFGLSEGRSAKDDPRLAGLRKYSTALEAGVFMDYWPIQDVIRARMELRHGLRTADGFTLDVGADLVKHFGPLTLSAGPRVSFLDYDEMKLEFGVSPRAAAANGHVTAFTPTTGLESVGINLVASYDVTPDVTFTVYDRYDRLVGDAADSPITQQFGTPNQNIVGVGLSYSLHTGK